MKVAVALQLAISLLTETTALQGAIGKAQAEGRTDLTDEEVAAFAGRDDAARARLQQRIDSLPA